MKILNTRRICNNNLANINELVSTAINKAVKEINNSMKFSNKDITAIPFTTSQLNTNISSTDSETVCVGLILSYNKNAALSYFKSLPQSTEYVIEDLPGDDLADQPVDFLDEDLRESTVYESNQDTIDDSIEVINSYLEYGDLKNDPHLLATKNILEAKKQELELDYTREEKIIACKKL